MLLYVCIYVQYVCMHLHKMRAIYRRTSVVGLGGCVCVSVSVCLFVCWSRSWAMQTQVGRLRIIFELVLSVKYLRNNHWRR